MADEDLNTLLYHDIFSKNKKEKLRYVVNHLKQQQSKWNNQKGFFTFTSTHLVQHQREPDLSNFFMKSQLYSMITGNQAAKVYT